MAKTPIQKEDYKQLLDIEKERHIKTRIKLSMRERELHDITSSSAFKLARFLAKAKSAVLYPLRVARGSVSRVRFKMFINKHKVTKAYQSDNFSSQIKEAKASSETAVVIHLFYTEMIDYFCDKLQTISKIDYDLYITIPESKQDEIDLIKSKCPNAVICIVPNCGRDVLPFVQVIKQLQSQGCNYKYVLKLHSKKSPHRVDGEQWRDKLVDSLLPKDLVLTSKLKTILEKKDTAIIGPEGEYVSLLVNYDSTGHHTLRLLKKIFSDKVAREMKPKSDEYGFFAGTMFWAKISAIQPVIDAVNVTDFEPEMGQVDSTLAHALERLFTVVPELHNKNIYEIDNNEIIEIDTHTSNIPEWSEVAIKPER